MKDNQHSVKTITGTKPAESLYSDYHTNLKQRQLDRGLGKGSLKDAIELTYKKRKSER